MPTSTAGVADPPVAIEELDPPETDPTEQWIGQMGESVAAARRASTRWRTVHELAANERVTAYSHGSGQPFRWDPGTDSATSGQRSERSDE